MNLTTTAPIRNWWYKFFVIQHLLTFFGFIIIIMRHLPETALYCRVYIWIPIGLYIFDRLIRALQYSYNNIRSGRATLVKEPGGVTKIIVRSRQVKRWTPGSFVLPSLPRFGIGQSHPVTIASTPTSHGGDLVFFLQARHGFTRRIQAGCTRIDCLDSSIDPEKERALSATTYLALIDGPYRGSHLDFTAFDPSSSLPAPQA
jgi:ferric-chelate reductase